ncbi:MAG: DUF2877 domain-containing protein [Acidimicrobiaceae bacterium]|nr:DUF2877 domain-containing protein [Acidimicrobiaceae bacterium]MYF41842.1 DUF2877 domain-containing protein [Acidimicrobiaceae bacterium]MYJ34843.1 DUF2877 domain-containing protein [Acidimicrobiaceae bacterium]
MEAQVRLAPETARPHGTAAAGPLSAVSVGQAVLEAASEGFAGRVAGVFRDGFYVSGSSETLFAVLGPGAWPGPLHLVVVELPDLPGRHDRVSVGGGVLTAGRLTVRLDGCELWAPSLPEHLGADSRAWQDLAACPAPELATVWEAVTGDVGRGDLTAATRRLQGRGTGLTPSGDDVLAGILLVGAIDPSRRPDLAHLALEARTTRLSRAFLRWAAAGHSIQPSHALLDASASGDHAGMREAAASLAGVGATSGRALVAGIALAATGLALTSARTMTPRPADVRRR